jgi:hypothetical protein
MFTCVYLWSQIAVACNFIRSLHKLCLGEKMNTVVFENDHKCNLTLPRMEIILPHRSISIFQRTPFNKEYAYELRCKINPIFSNLIMKISEIM